MTQRPSELDALERPERIDDAPDQLRQLMEGWDDRLRFEGLAIPERYLAGRIEFLADLDVLRRRQTKKYRAVPGGPHRIAREGRDHPAASGQFMSG